jgi:hypothetical protein
MSEISPEKWALIRKVASWPDETLEFFRREDPLYAALIEWARKKAASYQEIPAVCEEVHAAV